MNACMGRSAVRVIRGWLSRIRGMQPRRVIGTMARLYVIIRAWRQKGKQSKLTWRFLFQAGVPLSYLPDIFSSMLGKGPRPQMGSGRRQPVASAKCHVPLGDPKSWTSLCPLTLTHRHPLPELHLPRLNLLQLPLRYRSKHFLHGLQMFIGPRRRCRDHRCRNRHSTVH
ncbi:hypothetical protein CPB85DRAFT_1309066 [Mucidula mucida]|nr:hypothetical protein CPB85DRAFT_1309066 [Mucidula mucida]